MITCKQPLTDYAPPPQRVDCKHDLTLPISITPPIKKPAHLQEVDEHFNSYILREREVHSKRTVLKLAWECYARKSASNNNLQRLRNRSFLINLPSAEQAELVMKTVERVLLAMDGKLLSEL
jgi:hypothetical protein